MTCRHLHRYSQTDSKWSVAYCCAKGSPYVPSMFELNTFCGNSRHADCPSFLFPAGSAWPRVEKSAWPLPDTLTVAS